MAVNKQTRREPSLQPAKKPAFEPKEGTEPRITLPDELWLTILDAACTFPSDIFREVMLNLVKNPNVTSSHLFRADIFYDSESDHMLNSDDPSHGMARHMKEEYRPRSTQWPGFVLDRTIVRQLVPRNPQLDKSLIQTCQFFRRQDHKTEGEEAEQTLVLYSPHVERQEDMPFYHPRVSQLAFLHTWQPNSPSLDTEQTSTPSGSLTLFYRLFPNCSMESKLSRTGLRLLQTIHKHGEGQFAGYEKRVHHDQIIPQRRYQDTYTRLKTAYGRKLSEQWVEVTDPGKHVFEDIGIAAFLIELWRELYSLPGAVVSQAEADKMPFPGFVDIGCGNGVLTYILLSEGYPGWGFDARKRKTWSIFPDDVQDKLQQRILVPEILQQNSSLARVEDWHSGTFDRGTFIVSNHADELTPWTPLLAYMNDSAFIAIPCCSHDLSGARFRAPIMSKATKIAHERLPQQCTESDADITSDSPSRPGQAAETGSLQRNEAQKKMPSAYSSLCSYVSSLASEVGFKPEQDVLRIPSTRNSCIIGRLKSREYLDKGGSRKAQMIVELIERELKTEISSIAADWIGRAEKLMKKPTSGH